MMNEKPILFSGEMVRAILEGRKTQTRRVIKPQKMSSIHWIHEISNDDCPYGDPGDQLWVREAYSTYKEYDQLKPSDIPEGTKIFCEAEQVGLVWHADCGKVRPSIFMCRWMSRIQLEIKDVRVERLQDISIQDALAEGFPLSWDAFVIPKFQELWDSINAKRGYSWESNPWVWVVEFEKL